MLSTKIKVLFLILFILFFISIRAARAYSPEKAGFSLNFKDITSPHKVVSTFVLPGEELTLEVLDESENNHYVLESQAGSIIQESVNKWKWQAPEKKGFYTIKISKSQTLESITFHVFVMVPFSELKGEYLNGYRIGNYPNIPWKNLPIYHPPRGFIEVTKENEETYIAPHFQLKQFSCKQKGDYPKYVVLKELLLLKLELILERVNEEGYSAVTFNILSGYRTPYYNRVIGNVKYSRHLYGGSADIFIDESPKDNLMDDLNKDGKIDYRDSMIIYNIVDRMYGEPWYETFIGGLGLYRKASSHGPFVHVDVRGFRARWGT